MSPKHPRANGEAEAAVKTVKSLWRKNKDKNKALLEYRATPIPGIDLSPSQLSMGRRLRTTLPIARGLLEPETYNIKEVKARMKHGKEQQKHFYDRQGTKDLPPLKPGDPVRVKPEPGSKEWRAATVVQKHALPRSYVVDVGGRRIRRNRVALRIDSAKSHAEYQKCHPNSVQQPEPCSGNPCTVPTFQADTQMEQPVQDHNPDLTTAPPPSPPATALPPPSDTAEAKDSAPYTTRSGRRVKKPSRLNL